MLPRCLQKISLNLVLGACTLIATAAHAFTEEDTKTSQKRLFAPPAEIKEAPSPAPKPEDPAQDKTLYFDDEDASRPIESKDSVGGTTPTGNTATASPLMRTTSESDYDFHNWGFTGALGVAAGAMYGRGTLSIPVFPYLFTDVSICARKEQNKDYDTEAYCGELDLVLRLKNRTIFTPYVGAGGGYERWEIVSEEGSLDDNHSFTTSYFFGVLIHFTKHFGLTVAQRNKFYLNDPPAEIDGGKVNVGERHVASVDVGFQVMF